MDSEIKWRAPEFDYYPKTTSWYYFSILITLAILGFAIWQKNYLFGFFIVVAEFLTLSWVGRKPETLDFSLGEKGLAVGELKFYPYSDIKSFGETDLPPSDKGFVEIVLYFNRKVRPGIFIRIPKDMASEIEAALEKNIPKVEAELSIFDALERIIHF